MNENTPESEKRKRVPVRHQSRDEVANPVKKCKREKRPGEGYGQDGMINERLDPCVRAKAWLCRKLASRDRSNLPGGAERVGRGRSLEQSARLRSRFQRSRANRQWGFCDPTGVWRGGKAWSARLTVVRGGVGRTA